jgi:hypothetical protein
MISMGGLLDCKTFKNKPQKANFEAEELELVTFHPAFLYH